MRLPGLVVVLLTVMGGKPMCATTILRLILKISFILHIPMGHVLNVPKDAVRTICVVSYLTNILSIMSLPA